MIYAYFAGLILLVWYAVDKNLGEKFFVPLKYSVLLICLILIAFDLYMFVQTERFLYAREIDATNGVKYSWFDTVGNVTIETYMFQLQGEDSATVMAHHHIQYTLLQNLIRLIPWLAALVVVGLAAQYIAIGYEDIIKGKK